MVIYVLSEEELQNSWNADMTKSSDMLNKVQKGEANQKQQLSDYNCD